MIETRRLKNDVIFYQTILSFKLSRKINGKNATIHVFTISYPQIKRFLLGEAVISSKTDMHRSSKERRMYGKVGNNKAMSKILSFIRIL